MSRTASLLLLVAISIFLDGCGSTSQKRAYEYMPDMARTSAYKSFSPNPVMKDGMTLQRPVAGTIPRGFSPFHYGPGDEEAQRAGRELKNPHGPTREVLADGKFLYETYCLVCHGPSGKGDGPIAGKVPNPPSYTSKRVLEFQEGRIYHVITMGSGKMPSYAAQISADERWKVVAYVRSLQLADPAAAAAGAVAEVRSSGGMNPAPMSQGGGTSSTAHDPQNGRITKTRNDNTAKRKSTAND